MDSSKAVFKLNQALQILNGLMAEEGPLVIHNGLEDLQRLLTSAKMDLAVKTTQPAVKTTQPGVVNEADAGLSSDSGQ